MSPTGLETVPQARPTRGSTWREMICEIAVSRELLGQMVLRDVRLRYKQAVMGFAWALVMPLLVVAAGLVVRYAMGRLSGTAVDASALAEIAVKAVAWTFFVGALGFAATSLVGNINLVTKIYFPREVFPLSAVLTQALDSLLGAGMVLVFLLGVGVFPTWSALWAIPLLAVLFFQTLGLAMLLSSANVFFRDVKYLVQMLLTFGIFFTPVLYSPSLLGPTGGGWLMLNPLSPVLEGLRLGVVEHHNLLVALPAELWHPAYLAYSAAWAVLGFLGAWRVFHKLEFLYAEWI